MAADIDHNILDELVYLRKEVKRLRTRLNRLTPGLAALLKRRGFSIYKKEPSEDLFIPAKRYLNSYYLMLRKYSFRLFLRDVIKRQDRFSLETLTRYSTAGVTSSYLDYLKSLRLIRKKSGEFSVSKGPFRSFGETLEWFVAELLMREFGCEAVWSVKFRRPKVGGDYDVIAKIDGSLLYVEVKSSPPKQIYDSEITAFLDRVDDLSPEIAVFLMDTELRMKDKIVPMFEKALAARHERPPAVLRMERELFQFKNRVFIINAKEDILQNMEKVLTWHYRKRDEGRGSEGRDDEG
jgi:hypothetical protein